MPLVFSSKRFNLRGVLLCAALSLLARETAATSSQSADKYNGGGFKKFVPPTEPAVEKIVSEEKDSPEDNPAIKKVTPEVSPVLPYGYTSIVQPENPEEAKCDAIAQLTNASAEDGEGNTVGVQAKFTSLADGFKVIPQLIKDLAAAFNAKLQGMVNNVNTAFASMNTNVNHVVTQVQTDAHGKRGAVITHVNTEGTKAQTVINALQTAQNGLINARAAAEAERQQANADAEKARAEKDTLVTQKLDEHNDQIAGHTDQLDNHLERLDSHEGKLDTQRHQLDLAKAAMDQDLAGGYGSKHLKNTSADMLRDWDQVNASEDSKAVHGRRRLVNRSKSHTVVLDALSEEINRQN